jgi:hypothetical protein
VGRRCGQAAPAAPQRFEEANVKKNANAQRASTEGLGRRPDELAEILSDLRRNTEWLIAWSSAMGQRVAEVAVEIDSRAEELLLQS